MRKLNPGDSFPVFEVQTVAHGQVSVPEAFTGRYAALLFYRGGW